MPRTASDAWGPLPPATPPAAVALALASAPGPAADACSGSAVTTSPVSADHAYMVPLAPPAAANSPVGDRTACAVLVPGALKDGCRMTSDEDAGMGAWAALALADALALGLALADAVPLSEPPNRPSRPPRAVLTRPPEDDAAEDVEDKGP